MFEVDDSIYKYNSFDVMCYLSQDIDISFVDINLKKNSS